MASSSLADPGFRVSSVPLFDPVPYSAELSWYISGLLALMRMPMAEPAVAEFCATYVTGHPPAGFALAGLTDAEAADLHHLTLHGIFKDLGAGGVCALLKTEPGVLAFLMPRGVDPSRLRSSWDSVTYLSPQKVTRDGSVQERMHRDARLGAPASRFQQCLLNVSTNAQLGPQGDASFACAPGSQDEDWVRRQVARAAEEAGLAHEEAIAGPASAGKPAAKDWVRASDFLGPLWHDGVAIERVSVCGGGGVAWDSRLLHCGSFFHAPGRPHARMVKYVHLFSADECPAPARKTHELFVGALGAGAPPSGVQPSIAPTTPHRGNRKNSTGYLSTFRAAGRKLALCDAVNGLIREHERVRQFFSLPHMLARSLSLLGACDREAPLTDVAAQVALYLGDAIRRAGGVPPSGAAGPQSGPAPGSRRDLAPKGQGHRPGPEGAAKEAGEPVAPKDLPLLRPEAFSRLDQLCRLHAPVPKASRPTLKRPRPAR